MSPAPTAISGLSLHDALPFCAGRGLHTPGLIRHGGWSAPITGRGSSHSRSGSPPAPPPAPPPRRLSGRCRCAIGRAHCAGQPSLPQWARPRSRGAARRPQSDPRVVGIHRTQATVPRNPDTLADTSDFVTSRRVGRMNKVALDRPKALNSLDLDMCRALHAELDAATADSGVEAVVTTSTSEKAFCAGGDIRALRDAAASGDHEAN